MARTHVFVVALVVCLFAPLTVAAQAPPGRGWVTLPVNEFRDLRARANAPAPPAEAAATITRIDYTLTTANELVTGQAALSIDVVGAGWVAVPLPAGLVVREARLDGQPLVLDVGPPPVVHLSRSGRAVLTLDLAFIPAEAAGGISITLPPSTAAATRVIVDVPGTAHRLTADGGVVTSRTTAADRTTWTIHGRARASLALTWTRRRDDPRAQAPLRLGATVDETVGMRDTLVQVAATVVLDVREGLARDAVLTVPSGLTITDVRGSLVDDWRVEGDRLRVSFVEPVGSSTRNELRADALAPAVRVEIPLVRVPVAERETGTVTVDVGQEAEITEATAVGLDPVDARQTGARPGPGRPDARVFRWQPSPGQAERRLAVAVARYAAEAVPVATVDEARYRVLTTGSGRSLVEARYLVRSNQRSALAVRLPGGAQVWQVRVGPRAVRPGRADDGQLVVPLDTTRTGDAPATALVAVVYLQDDAPWIAGVRRQLTLPAIDLPVARSALVLHHPPETRLAVHDGTFRLDDEPEAFAAPLRHGDQPPLYEDTRTGVDAEVLTLLADARGTADQARSLADDAPLDVPALGPAIFLRAELTPESVAPVVDLTLRRR